MVVQAVSDGSFPDSGLPVAEILVLSGFLMIYLVEEVAGLLMGGAEKPVRRDSKVSECCHREMEKRDIRGFSG